MIPRKIGLNSRQPTIPLSPLVGLGNSFQVIIPNSQSTPVSSPTKGPKTPVITPNPYFTPAHQSYVWDNAGEELIGVEREAATLISGVNRLGSETNPYLLDDCQIPVVSTDSSSLSCSGEVFEQDYYSTKITIMSEFEKAITKANEYLGTARDYIEIFDVDDVDEGRLPVVERDLDRIMDQVMAYRKQVRLIKESFTLSEAQTVALDNESKNLLSEAKSHAKLIRNKVQQVAPSRSMSAFEKASEI